MMDVNRLTLIMYVLVTNALVISLLSLGISLYRLAHMS